MLVTSIFSFSHNFFTISRTNFKFSVTSILSSTNTVILDQSKVCLLDLISEQTTKSQAHVRAMVDDEVNIAQMTEIDLGIIENIVGKEKKCWLPFAHFLLFQQCFLFFIQK